jgi:cystathionine beta-lyase/cystathionine gamma-synthase
VLSCDTGMWLFGATNVHGLWPASPLLYPPNQFAVTHSRRQHMTIATDSSGIEPRHAETALLHRTSADGPLAPVMHASSTFASATPEEAARKARRPRVTDFYGRYGNPTVQEFADAVADLEHAEAGLCSSSGMGAISSLVLALCSQGSHVVTQRQLFSGTALLFGSVCPRFGIDVTFVDVDDASAWAAAVEPGRTTLVFAESPANPGLALVDLAAIGAIKNSVTVVDSTLATPLVQRPIDHGVDLVVHSATKALSGHNDATLGVIAGDKTLINEIWTYATVHGACASPYDSWNGLRGLKTLGVRHERQSANALAVATALERHPAVTSVQYPGLPSFRQADLAARQMANGGACVTLDLAGGYDAAVSMAEKLELGLLAPSLGGPETLVNHPASMTHAALSPEQRTAMGIGEGMIRLSLGLERAADLVRDFEQALSRN